MGYSEVMPDFNPIRKSIVSRFRLALCFLVLSMSSQASAQQSLVSLVELLANPERALAQYPDGVSTVGYLHFDGAGGPRLFLTRDHALAGDIGSALVILDDTDKNEIYEMKCDNEYVRVIGMVVGSLGDLSLTRIESIRRTQDQSFCFQRETG